MPACLCLCGVVLCREIASDRLAQMQRLSSLPMWWTPACYAVLCLMLLVLCWGSAAAVWLGLLPLTLRSRLSRMYMQWFPLSGLVYVLSIVAEVSAVYSMTSVQYSISRQARLITTHTHTSCAAWSRKGGSCVLPSAAAHIQL